jgi:hypothetical protein
MIPCYDQHFAKVDLFLLTSAVPLLSRVTARVWRWMDLVHSRMQSLRPQSWLCLCACTIFQAQPCLCATDLPPNSWFYHSSRSINLSSFQYISYWRLFFARSTASQGRCVERSGRDRLKNRFFQQCGAWVIRGCNCSKQVSEWVREWVS